MSLKRTKDEDYANRGDGSGGDVDGVVVVVVKEKIMSSQ